MLNVNKCAKAEPNPKSQQLTVRTAHVCVSLCTTVVDNTAQNSYDDFPSYSPDDRHCSDDA